MVDTDRRCNIDDECGYAEKTDDNRTDAEIIEDIERCIDEMAELLREFRSDKDNKK